MTLSQIRDFIAVVESGGIRAAARKLGVSQPAITRSVRGLETELRARLLRRTPTGVVPTQPGRALFARARAAQAELRKAEEEVDQLAQTTRAVAFGVSPTSAIVVPEAVTRFRQQFPQARIHIAEGLPQSLIPMVRDETLDFAICRRALVEHDSGLAFRPLFRNDFAVVARKGHPLEKASSLAQLVDACWTSLLPLDAPDGPFAQAFSPTGLCVPKQVIQCESYNTAIRLDREDRHGRLPGAPAALRSAAERSAGNTGRRAAAVVRRRHVHAHRYAAYAGCRRDGQGGHRRGAPSRPALNIHSAPSVSTRNVPKPLVQAA